MLIQVDDSHHRWLGDKFPPFALLAEQENTRDYFLLMRVLK